MGIIRVMVTTNHGVSMLAMMRMDEMDDDGGGTEDCRS